MPGKSSKARRTVATISLSSVKLKAFLLHFHSFEQDIAVLWLVQCWKLKFYSLVIVHGHLKLVFRLILRIIESALGLLLYKR